MPTNVSFERGFSLAGLTITDTRIYLILFMIDHYHIKIEIKTVINRFKSPTGFWFG